MPCSDPRQWCAQQLGGGATVGLPHRPLAPPWAQAGAVRPLISLCAGPEGPLPDLELPPPPAEEGEAEKKEGDKKKKKGKKGKKKKGKLEPGAWLATQCSCHCGSPLSGWCDLPACCADASAYPPLPAFAYAHVRTPPPSRLPTASASLDLPTARS